MPTRTGGQLFAEMLESYGTSHVFFVPALMLATMAELRARGITPVSAHGEKAAAYMADGYARASRKPGFCMAQAVGAANLAAGLKDAYMAG
jgi:acetolactate synthase-1/2/3 large subunit